MVKLVKEYDYADNMFYAVECGECGDYSELFYEWEGNYLCESCLREAFLEMFDGLSIEEKVDFLPDFLEFKPSFEDKEEMAEEVKDYLLDWMIDDIKGFCNYFEIERSTEAELLEECDSSPW